MFQSMVSSPLRAELFVVTEPISHHEKATPSGIHAPSIPGQGLDLPKSIGNVPLSRCGNGRQDSKETDRFCGEEEICWAGLGVRCSESQRTRARRPARPVQGLEVAEFWAKVVVRARIANHWRSRGTHANRGSSTAAAVAHRL